MELGQCPFCLVQEPWVQCENEFAAAIFDKFPIAKGQTLIVPKRHVASPFDLTEEEQAAVWRWQPWSGGNRWLNSSWMDSTSASMTAPPPGNRSCTLMFADAQRGHEFNVAGPGMRYIQFRFVPLPASSVHGIIAIAFELVK